MSVKAFAYLFLVLLVVLTACKKEEDETPPVVRYELPFENHIYAVFDTVPVRAFLEDETQIVSVTLGLSDENFRPVSSTFEYTVTGNPMTLHAEYPISDKFLESGTYYMTIKVSDGENIKAKYQKIRITGFPREFQGLALVTQSQGRIEVHKRSLSGEDTLVYQSQQDYASSSFSSRRGQMLLLGEQDNGALIDFQLKQVLWDLPSFPNPPFPSFLTSAYYDKQYYVSYYDGRVEAYDYLKNVRLSLPAEGNLVTKNLFFHNDYIMAYKESKSVVNYKQLSVYYPTGANFITHTFAMEIKAVASRSQNEVLLFKSSTTAGEIEVFDLTQNNGWEAQQVPSAIVDALGIGTEDSFVATADEVYWYRYTTSSLVPFIQQVSPQKLLFDDLSSTLYVVEENAVKAYEFPSGQFLFELQQNNIVDAHLIYSI